MTHSLDHSDVVYVSNPEKIRSADKYALFQEKRIKWVEHPADATPFSSAAEAEKKIADYRHRLDLERFKKIQLHHQKAFEFLKTLPADLAPQKEALSDYLNSFNTHPRVAQALNLPATLQPLSAESASTPSQTGLKTFTEADLMSRNFFFLFAPTLASIFQCYAPNPAILDHQWIKECLEHQKNSLQLLAPKGALADRFEAGHYPIDTSISHLDPWLQTFDALKSFLSARSKKDALWTHLVEDFISIRKISAPSLMIVSPTKQSLRHEQWWSVAVPDGFLKRQTSKGKALVVPGFHRASLFESITEATIFATQSGVPDAAAVCFQITPQNMVTLGMAKLSSHDYSRPELTKKFEQFAVQAEAEHIEATLNNAMSTGDLGGYYLTNFKGQWLKQAQARSAAFNPNDPIQASEITHGSPQFQPISFHYHYETVKEQQHATLYPSFKEASHALRAAVVFFSQSSFDLFKQEMGLLLKQISTIDPARHSRWAQKISQLSEDSSFQSITSALEEGLTRGTLKPDELTWSDKALRQLVGETLIHLQGEHKTAFSKSLSPLIKMGHQVRQAQVNQVDHQHNRYFDWGLTEATIIRPQMELWLQCGPTDGTPWAVYKPGGGQLPEARAMDFDPLELSLSKDNDVETMAKSGRYVQLKLIAEKIVPLTDTALTTLLVQQWEDVLITPSQTPVSEQPHALTCEENTRMAKPARQSRL